jgi:hypothetical protein
VKWDDIARERARERKKHLLVTSPLPRMCGCQKPEGGEGGKSAVARAQGTKGSMEAYTAKTPSTGQSKIPDS